MADSAPSQSYLLERMEDRDEKGEERWAEWTELWPADFNIPNLQNHEDHYEWFWRTKRKLEVLNLWGFIKGTECPPQWDGPIAERVRQRFSRRSYRAFWIIHDSVQPILPELRMNRSWLIEENGQDPQVLWQAIARWNTDIPYYEKSRLLREFSNIDRVHFDSLDAYSIKASWFNHRIQELNIAVPEEVQMGFVIHGLRSHHLDWAIAMSMRIGDGSHTFHTLLREVGGLKDHEKRLKDIHENNTTDANRQCNDNNSNNKRRQNNKRRRNIQGHRQQHNGVTKRYSIRQ